MARTRFRSAWQCDSDVDYYEQFESNQPDDDFIEPDDDFESHDDDCDYWKNVMAHY